VRCDVSTKATLVTWLQAWRGKQQAEDTLQDVSPARRNGANYFELVLMLGLNFEGRRPRPKFRNDLKASFAVEVILCR